MSGGDEMLTEKQLQALVGCGEKEDCTGETCPMFETCDNDYTNKVAAEAAQTALAYREILERHIIEEGHYSSLEELAEVKKLLKESEVEEG
jgi:hypothetical protein